MRSMKNERDRIYLYSSPLTRPIAKRLGNLSNTQIASSRNLEKLSISLAFLNVRDPGNICQIAAFSWVPDSPSGLSGMTPGGGIGEVVFSQRRERGSG